MRDSRTGRTPNEVGSQTVVNPSGDTKITGNKLAFEEVFTEDGEISPSDRKLFSVLQKPRVRYDVEVVTKLIVYSGLSRVNMT